MLEKKVYEILTKAKNGDPEAMALAKQIAKQYGHAGLPSPFMEIKTNSSFNASVMKFQSALGTDLLPMVAGEYIALASAFSGGALKIGLEAAGYAVTFTSELPNVRTDSSSNTIEDLIKNY